MTILIMKHFSGRWGWVTHTHTGKLLRGNEFEHCSSLDEHGWSERQCLSDSHAVVIMTSITITGQRSLSSNAEGQSLSVTVAWR